MNSYGYNNHNKLLISKFIVLIADYISIVLGTLAAYHLRLNLPFLPVSPHFKVDEIYVYGVIPLVFLAILLLNNTYSVVSPYWDTMKNLFRSITIGVVVSIVLMYTGHVINDVSR
ncbi:MAG: undecaprenyl-phosphate galactose phosphotransferase WbaP, partial [Veillonella sp.]|nr:undecaprenyl-phosphate galactose phosphotransferase WbaP [Veillonella sp.]